MPGRPAFEIRGMMLDPARLTERHEFYFDLLPQLAHWGFNTLWWHFSDDEGFALKLESHPELASPFALSKAQTRRLVLEAAKLGITVVPEVESLGHALYATRLKQYRHLFLGRPYGHNALAPCHPQTLKLIANVMTEVVDIFDGPYLHAGLDEADFGDDARVKRLGRGKPPYWVWLQHALEIHKIVTGLGKRMIIWADAIEHNPPLLKKLPKDIILAHWHYGEVPAEKIVPSVKAGFHVICTAAISPAQIQPDARAFQNTDDNMAVARRLRPRCLGVVSCWWQSFQHLRDTYGPATAYVGQATRTGKPGDRIAFARRFAREHFGPAAPAAGKTLWRMHELTADWKAYKSLFFDSISDMHEAIKIAERGDFSTRLEQATETAAAWQKLRPKVRRRVAEFDAFGLSARLIEMSLRNAAGLRFAYDTYRRAEYRCDAGEPTARAMEMLDLVTATLTEIQGRLAESTKAVAKEWDRTRYPRDGKKDGSSPLMRQRNTKNHLRQMLRAERFLDGFLRSFKKGIKVFARTGVLPGSL